jgi:two-component system, NarL family, response regulator YdfI
VIVLALPPADVDALVRTLARAPDPPAVVLLADDPQAAWTAQARRAGVRAVLSREAGAAEIAAAIHAVAAGLVALHPDVVEPARVSAGAPAPASAATGQPLTPREVEILGMMAEGLGNKIIAARLGISDHTVKFHLASIFAKLGAGSRTEAVTLGIRRGFIVI